MHPASSPSTGLHDWPTRRLELLATRLCDLPIRLEDTLYRGVIERVRRDVERRGLGWFPPIYLSTGWHCPERIPVVGVPFGLATPELRRLEQEITKQLETPAEMVRLLRHEVGHAYNYAYRLHATPEWRRLFGPFSQPYREHYPVRPRSKQYVRHLPRHYAQKHPDEDFAETFAVWLTPKARWRREFEGWGCMRKLEYVDRTMRELVGWLPTRAPRRPMIDHLPDLEHVVRRHYQRLGYRVSGLGFEDAAVGFVDEALRRIFPPGGRRSAGGAARRLRGLKGTLVDEVARATGDRTDEARELHAKYVERCTELGLGPGRLSDERLLVVLAATMASHLVTRRHTGRVSEPPRRVG